MIDYQDKKVVIIGLGVTGLSSVDYFLSKNVIPRVIDTRQQPPALEHLDQRVIFHGGDLRVDWLLEADLIVVSPGIALSTPELKLAAENGIEIIGDIELFCREINQLKDKKVVAITGSNGKTTVTTLVGEMAKATGKSVAVGGNIGEPVLTLLSNDYDIYILELSSFQLETTFSLHATVATILNITEDHMDRYPEGITQYMQAKQRIYHHAQVCLFNADDPLTRPKAGYCDSCGQFGIAQGEYRLDSHAQSLVIDGDAVLDTMQMNLFGLHNYMNALVALAIADQLAITREISLTVLKQFKGLAHRFELVHEKHGIRWINDSKATNVGSTEAALRSIKCTGRIHLLLGGDGKQADFSPLKPYLQNNITIYAFGRDRQLLAQLNPDSTTQFETMAQAMNQIIVNLHAGDIVLLSPACASLDQFKNYMERGKLFAMLAKELGA